MALWIQKKPLAEVQNKSAIPDMVWSFLSLRIQSEDHLQKILQPKLSDLQDPLSILNMDKAVSRLLESFQIQEKICIYADFDLDGTSGLAILKTGLSRLGYNNVLFYQPKRLSEGYGFHPAAVVDLYEQGVRLIITVDVGITSFAAFDKANELDLDVILTDHHLPISDKSNEKLPNAFCIVNPNQKNCKSDLKYLCGAGVAFYLLRALMSQMQKNNLLKSNFDLKEVLDFFCIGTITDMVPLIDDNRVLVKHGMIALQNTNKPGLRELLDNLGLLGRDLTSQDVAIKFAPKLNALSRMESEILPRDIYLEQDTVSAKNMIQRILKNNETRQNLQHSAVETAELALLTWAEKDFNFIFSKTFHRGVIGLIATKIANDTNRPTFIGSLDEDGMIVGSSRLPAGSHGNLVDALASAEKLLNRFGGHAAAAGFELPLSATDQFTKCLMQHYFQLAQAPVEVHLVYDAIVQSDELNQSAMKWYNFTGPYGVGFPVPLFRLNEVELLSYKEIKGGHVKITAQNKNSNKPIDILYFSPVEAKKNILKVGLKYDFLGEIQTNYFRKTESIQFLAKDFELHAE